MRLPRGRRSPCPSTLAAVEPGLERLTAVLLSQAVLIPNLIGTFVFAISGGVAGVKERVDIFGLAVLAFAADDGFAAECHELRRQTGNTASPFNAWLVLRGLRTLPVRVERHCRNAAAVAEFLQAHARVAAVHYPGLAAHPGHAIAARQMHGGFGGMLSFEVAGGREAALEVAGRLRLFTNATSLGSTESLVEHRASIEGPQSASPEGLLRLSVGLEDPRDLVDDLAQALG